MDKMAHVGVDLAKNLMQVHAVDSLDHVVVRKVITRERFVIWFAHLEPCLTVFVNVVVASLPAHCSKSARGIRSGLSQTSFFNSQWRVEPDHRCGLLALACA